MKRQPKKLVVASETVRKLEHTELANIQGGLRTGEDCTTITSGSTLKSKIICTIG